MDSGVPHLAPGSGGPPRRLRESAEATCAIACLLPNCRVEADAEEESENRRPLNLADKDGAQRSQAEHDSETKSDPPRRVATRRMMSWIRSCPPTL